ncbi:dTDP-glucose 4,6-dehydratase [Streptomyces bauhiniae]
MKVLITGGAGFIGSHFAKRMLDAEDIEQVTVLDALTYAGHRTNLGRAFLSPKFEFVHGNICDVHLVNEVMRGHQAVVHFAAESHVDRSLKAAAQFVETNVHGTQNLVDAAVRHHIERFVHVSTDEVYGPLLNGEATEDFPLRPTVPYAASKAASDLVARSAWHTYGLPLMVTRSSNNFGPCQNPEKIIPLFVTRLLRGEKVTLHSRGQHVRNWLHVEDHCAGVELVLRRGEPGEIYNLGGGTDLTSKELTGLLLDISGADWDAVTYIQDRPSNDARYALDWSKACKQLGYQPVRDLGDGLRETAAWYRDNPDRWAPLTTSTVVPVPGPGAATLRTVQEPHHV